jgi:hypothetical protein
VSAASHRALHPEPTIRRPNQNPVDDEFLVEYQAINGNTDAHAIRGDQRTLIVAANQLSPVELEFDFHADGLARSFLDRFLVFRKARQKQAKQPDADSHQDQQRRGRVRRNLE